MHCERSASMRVRLCKGYDGVDTGSKDEAEASVAVRDDDAAGAGHGDRAGRTRVSAKRACLKTDQRSALLTDTLRTRAAVGDLRESGQPPGCVRRSCHDAQPKHDAREETAMTVDTTEPRVGA